MRTAAACYLAVALLLVLEAGVNPGPYGLGFVLAFVVTAPLSLVVNLLSRGAGWNAAELATALAFCAAVQAAALYLFLRLLRTAIRRP
jgi:hypothetical protein